MSSITVIHCTIVYYFSLSLYLQDLDDHKSNGGNAHDVVILDKRTKSEYYDTLRKES